MYRAMAISAREKERERTGRRIYDNTRGRDAICSVNKRVSFYRYTYIRDNREKSYALNISTITEEDDFHSRAWLSHKSSQVESSRANVKIGMTRCSQPRKTLTPPRSPRVCLFLWRKSSTFYLSANSSVLHRPIHEGNTNTISPESDLLSAFRTLEPQTFSAAA